jgi:hypothetical protein
MEQYCIASEVLSRCRENAHSFSAEVNKTCNSLVSMHGSQPMSLGFMILKTNKPQGKKHFIYATLSN